ncbi:pilus (MSHA type) biogenesis protein MshL [Campylobacter mucosalis]|uniref:Transformation system, type II secretion system secretin protein CtsD n=1 Tax=Campylobacter mucosalis CCUG 21559 TaxID=1032067 RepID=A0A6G5QHP8_9BACT|nr:transformation system, type II secretion system secretin protein CtsD [Campylobacter mucosalis CCUG 21559]
MRLKLGKILLSLVFILSFEQSLFAKSVCVNKNFSMKFKSEVTLNEVLNELSDMCSFSVVAKDQAATAILQENLNATNINNLSLSEVFALLLTERNLSYEFNKNILKISSFITKSFKIDYITSIREGISTTKASVDSAPIEVGNSNSSDEDEKKQDNMIRTTEKFDFWEKLDSEIKAVLNNPNDKITAPDPVINQNAGLVTITATPTQLKRVEKYIQDLQKRLKKQVIIDVSIIAVELKNEYKKGVDWSKFELGFNSYIGNDPTTSSGFTTTRTGFNSGFTSTINFAANLNLNLDGVLNFLDTNGKAKVISSPKITTLNNQQALISVGDNINYRVQEETERPSASSVTSRVTTTYKQYSVFVGILLNLLPEVSDDNKIMLRINPSLSSFKYREDDAKQRSVREIAPDTNQKKLSTVVQVNSGDTIILGGLIGQTKGKDNTYVPFLSAIPIIGNAFSSTKDITSTTELIFIITPRVIDPDTKTDISQSLKDLGFSKSINE